MASIEEKSHLLLEQALDNENGRKAKLLVNDGPLRQTVIALREGIRLAEHNSPPAASLFVLIGQVQITGQEESVIEEGEIVALTHFRHAVIALEDSVFLLTTVTNVEHGSHTDQSEDHL